LTEDPKILVFIVKQKNVGIRIVYKKIKFEITYTKLRYNNLCTIH